MKNLAQNNEDIDGDQKPDELEAHGELDGTENPDELDHSIEENGCGKGIGLGRVAKAVIPQNKDVDFSNVSEPVSVSREAFVIANGLATLVEKAGDAKLKELEALLKKAYSMAKSLSKGEKLRLVQEAVNG